jgi:hypothetical protein
MHRRITICGCVIVFTFVLHSTGAVAEPKIGSATAVKNDVQGFVEGKTRPIAKGSEVYANDLVRTGPESVADLIFLDQSSLSVGPTSEVKLDKFVYDPGGSSGSVVIQATKGAFRFVTGSQDKKVYEIKTPYGTLGVRG